MSRDELIQSGKSREIGKRIRLLRESRVDANGQAMSQESFGKLLGDLSLPKINRIENGRRMPDVEFLLVLKDEFSCDLNWLLTGEGGDQNESRASAKMTLLTMLKTDPDFRSEVLAELRLKPPTGVVRNKRIYNMLKLQRDDWQEIIDRTEQSVSEAEPKKRDAALDGVKAYREGIDYLDVLLEVGRAD